MAKEEKIIAQTPARIHPTDKEKADEVNKLIKEAKREGNKLKDMRLVVDDDNSIFSARLIEAPQREPGRSSRTQRQPAPITDIQTLHKKP